MIIFKRKLLYTHFFLPSPSFFFFILSETILPSNFIHIISLNLSFHVVCEFDLGIQLLKKIVRNVTYFFPIQNFWFRNNEDLVASNLHLFMLPFGRIVLSKNTLLWNFKSNSGIFFGIIIFSESIANAKFF